MTEPYNTDKLATDINKKKTFKQRVTKIAKILIVVICCAIIIVKIQHNKELEREHTAAVHTYLTNCQAQLKKELYYATQLAMQIKFTKIEIRRRQDSIARSQIVVPPEPPKPTWTWYDVLDMVYNLTNESYFASIWIVEPHSPKWVVIYTKGGKKYFRHFNAKNKTYGNKVRLIEEVGNGYYVAGNKRNRYVRDGNQLVHVVNGVEKERFYNFRLIDLHTPQQGPDDYEDYEDYYYDNEEDLIHYYGR